MLKLYNILYWLCLEKLGLESENIVIKFIY